MTRRYRSNPAVIPVPFPVPLPIAEQAPPTTPPPSPQTIPFTCFRISVYQTLSVPRPYAIANVSSRNVFSGCSGDVCFTCVEGVILKGYVFLSASTYAFIFACEAQLQQAEEQNVIIDVTENNQLYNFDTATQLNEVIQGQFVDKSEILEIIYGHVNVSGTNYLSFTQTELHIGIGFSFSFYDRISVFNTPFELITAKSVYLETSGIHIDILSDLAPGESYQFQTQLQFESMSELVIGESYQSDTGGILIQTEQQFEIGEQLYADNIIFKTELTIQ